MQGQTPQAIQRPSEVNMHGRLANEVSDKITSPPPLPPYIFFILMENIIFINMLYIFYVEY